MNVIKLHLIKPPFKKRKERHFTLFQSLFTFILCHHSEQSDLVSKTMQIKSRMLGKWKEIDTGIPFSDIKSNKNDRFMSKKQIGKLTLRKADLSSQKYLHRVPPCNNLFIMIILNFVTKIRWHVDIHCLGMQAKGLNV